MIKINLSELQSAVPEVLQQGCLIEVDGSKIPVKLKPGRGDDLVVLFHPALPPDRLAEQWFQAFLPVAAPQISIADPTLRCMEGVAAGWYLGGEGEALPSKISRVVQVLAELLGCHRRIYVGGSSGGFAALLYAGLDSGGVAVAACPQTSLGQYANSNVGKFVGQRYQSTKALPAEASLPAFFSETWRSAAVVLVSSGDHNHLFTQVLPFVSALGFQHRRKLVLNVDYHGIPGHSGSVPPAVYMPWVKFVLLCPDFDSDKVMDIHRKIKGTDRPVPAEARRQAEGGPSRTESADALGMADLLRDYHLRQPMED